MLPDMTLDDPQSILGVGADLVLTEDAPSEEQKKGLNDAGIDVVTIAPRYQPRRFYPPVPGGRFLHDGRREGIRTRGEDR